MAAKIFLTLVGLLYLSLATWCSLSPAVTSEKVGVDLKPGSGQSEFLVIYGGLELAMALIFLLPLIRPEYLAASLLSCVIIHGCLVLFRTASFFLFSGLSSMTYQLAVGEWIILIAGVICMFLARETA